MDNYLVNKYLIGDATEREVQQLFNWIYLSEDNKKQFIEYKKAWALTSASDMTSQSTEEGWGQVRKSLPIGQKNRKLYRVMRYVAILIIVFGIGMTVQYLSFKDSNENTLFAKGLTTIQVPKGQTSSVVLADGTEVVLNSGSSLSFFPVLTEGNRLVKLEGEGFFKVTHDSIHPFIVQTDDIDVKVYGTSFNVNAYAEENTVSATLVEGSIGLLDKKGHQLIRLAPNEKVTYKKETFDLKVEKVDARKFTAWKEGIFEFNNIKLSELAVILERWYNVEIVIEDSKREQVIYEGTILKHKSIHQILDILKYTANLNYKFEEQAGKPDIIRWY